MGFFQFHHFSISNKLVGIVIFSWLLIAALITSFFVGQDFYFFRSSTVSDLAGLARVISINCTAPLEFSDSDTATEVLSSLSARPHIHQAALYSRDNSVFARYISSDEEADEKPFPESFPYNIQEHGAEAFFFKGKTLELYVPVGINNEELGTLLLRKNLSDFTEKLIRTVYVVGGIMAASLFFAWIVSRKLQHYITNPILTMVAAMQRVRNEEEYSVRINNEFTDEISVLADGFNSMLDQVQNRDKQLIDAKQAAEDANRAKSTFLAQMSHEIRTPMNGVLGIASLLIDTSLNEKQTEFVRRISGSGEALLNVINDILDFSKIEAGKLELEEISFCPGDLAAETISLLSEQASRKGLRMSCIVDSDVPAYVAGDPGRLRQVLMNLLGNAIKFTPHGKVGLAIFLKSRYEDKIRLLFEVSDSGIGIQQDKLDKIFTAFSQADESTTRRFGGTGLGLVISEQLVKLMGGQIKVESEEGKGSTFYFTADFMIANNNAFSSNKISHYSKEHREGFESGNIQLSKAHILVAEDNQTNQIVTRGMLEKLGCTVDIAENGQEAVNAVHHKTYDLILMDCHMPNMDGYEASRIIRKPSVQGNDKRIPIIALTAHAMKGDREHCLAAGMDDYLSKPCTESQIKAVLEKWLPVDSRKELSGSDVVEESVDNSHDKYCSNQKVHEFVVEKSQEKAFVCKDDIISSAIDESVLQNLQDLQIEGKPDIVSKIINSYLRSSASLIPRLQNAFSEDDIEGVQNAAHSLRSSSASVGALGLAEIYAQIETNCSNNMLIDLAALVRAIEPEFHRVKNALKKVIDSK